MKNLFINKSRLLPGLLLILLALIIAFWYGCGQEPQTVTAPDKQITDIHQVMDIQERHTEALLRIQSLEKAPEGTREIRGVIGTATTILPDGRYAIKILTNKIAGMETRLPEDLDGVPVVIEEVGAIRALNFSGQQSDNSGASGGNANLDNFGQLGFCSSGTLGSKVANGGKFFILSNNHVLARENRAAIGEDIIQPGRADFEGCDDSQVRHIADLYAFQEIGFVSHGGNIPENRIDAAIAKIRSGVTFNAMTECGFTPSTTPVIADIGMEVKKCGRTTMETSGTVTAINVTVVVNYGPSGPALFTGQIQTTGMSDSGDSGSLLVTQDGNHPVGLLFAGSSTTTIHNPIKEVLDTFGVHFASE